MLLIQIGSEFFSKDVIADEFVAAAAIPFIWLFFISLIVFSNVGSGSNFAASKLLFALIWSNFLSKGVVILVISNFDGSLTNISLIISVASERHGVFYLRVTSSSSIFSDSWCCCYIKSIHSSSRCSKFWSYLSNLAWILVSKQSSEDKVSEGRVTILFPMCSDENIVGYICCSTLNSISYSSGFSNPWLYGEIFSWDLLSNWSSEDGCSEVIVGTQFWKIPLYLEKNSVI